MILSIKLLLSLAHLICLSHLILEQQEMLWNEVLVIGLLYLPTINKISQPDLHLSEESILLSLSLPF